MSNGIDFYSEKLHFGRNGGEGQNKKMFIDGYSPDTSDKCLTKSEENKKLNLKNGKKYHKGKISWIFFIYINDFSNISVTSVGICSI